MSKTITVSDATYECIKNQLNQDEQVDLSSLNDLVKKSWFFRTVTYHLVGEVVKVVGNIVQLKNASWVADSGKFSTAIKDGVLNEVEFLGDWFVNMPTVTDFGLWNHKLPEKSK